MRIKFTTWPSLPGPLIPQSSTVYGSLMSTCILCKTAKQMVECQWRLGQGHALLGVYKHLIKTNLKKPKSSPTFSNIDVHRIMALDVSDPFTR